jgi:small redox-active disulfide protein 2
LLTIKVLGSGCANCQKLEESARISVAQLGIEADIMHVRDKSDIAGYRLLATPGLVINEKVVSAGRLPSPAEITVWLADAANDNQ